MNLLKHFGVRSDTASYNDEYRQYCKKCKQFVSHSILGRMPNSDGKAKAIIVQCDKCGGNKLLVRE